MKRKIAMIMTTTLLVLSLSACGSSSGESIADSEDAAAAENEAAESTDEIQAADESANAQIEEVPTEETQVTPTEGTETTPAEGTETTPEAGTQDGAAETGSGTVEGGKNQVEAVQIAVGQQILGTNEDNSWYCFTTGSDKDTEYQVTITNMTGEGTIQASLLDTFGDELANVHGESDGTAGTASSRDKLDPDTVYYIHVSNYYYSGELAYALVVRDSTKE